MPRPREENTAIYAGVEIPELGSNATTWAAIVPTKYFYNNLQPDGSPDKRRDMNIVSSWNGETFTGSKIYFGPKFWCYGMTQTYDSNNYPIFRYADAVLMKAECLCMQEEDAALSIEYLNKVKRRAGITEYTAFPHVGPSDGRNHDRTRPRTLRGVSAQVRPRTLGQLVLPHHLADRLEKSLGEHPPMP